MTANHVNETRDTSVTTRRRAGWIGGLILIAIGATFALLLIGSLLLWNPTTPSVHQSLGIAQSPRGGDFTLQSPNGSASLHDYKGKVVLLYFGYTFCPDICPTSLGFTTQALSALTPDELKKVQMLFVTVDPERDTLDKLKAYTAYFHPSVLGLTGSPEEIAKVARLYGAMYVLMTLEDFALPPENLEGIEELVKDLTLVKVPGSGHFVPWEAPAAVNAAMDEFLGRTC